MYHAASSNEYVDIWAYSMCKRFRIRAITTTDDEANDFMANHQETALIACFGPFNIIANKYEGEKS